SSSPFKKFLVRAASGVVMVGIVAGIIALGRVAMSVAVLSSAFLIFAEVHRIKKLHQPASVSFSFKLLNITLFTLSFFSALLLVSRNAIQTLPQTPTLHRATASFDGLKV
ncbi:hypothetical protein KIPB_012363, partial [Kipferlia bialata]